MTLLALDLGTRTGWAIGGSRIDSGVQDFALRRGESPGMRFVHFSRWLATMIPAPGSVTLCCYELAHHRGGAATEIGVGMVTRVQERCAALDVTYAGVHSATLKKHATGKGNAKKPDMLAAARARLGYPGSDDNECDALWLLHYARTELVGTGGTGRDGRLS